MGTRCADHVTPLYPQKLALTSPTGGGRSVGIVRVRTKATEREREIAYVKSQICFTSAFDILWPAYYMGTPKGRFDSHFSRSQIINLPWNI